MYNGKGRFSTFTQDFKNVFSKNILVFFLQKITDVQKVFFFYLFKTSIFKTDPP